MGLLQKLEKVATTDAEVLISGPTGTGKELYANFVHEHSRRRQRPFVAVNCGSLNNGLLENELFGHVGGAFTGARPKSEGLVQSAEGGTLFLDEVDSLAPPCQVRLLRFLQDKSYRRLGETRLRRANVRIVSATNVDLAAKIRGGEFREDLYFRLRVVPVEIPALRDRIDDLPGILEVFVARYAQAYGLPPVRLSIFALTRMQEYSWPGNVRELENCVRYLTCMQLEGPARATDLPLLDESAIGDEGSTGTCGAGIDGPFRIAKRDAVDRFERQYLEEALWRARGNISQAARASGKNRRAFFELLRKHQVDPADFRLESAAKFPNRDNGTDDPAGTLRATS